MMSYFDQLFLLPKLSQLKQDRFCGLAVRVPSYRSRGPGSSSGAKTFSEK
jgi:hypothetical protein